MGIVRFKVHEVNVVRKASTISLYKPLNIC